MEILPEIISMLVALPKLATSDKGSFKNVDQKTQDSSWVKNKAGFIMGKEQGQDPNKSNGLNSERSLQKSYYSKLY